MGIVLKVLVWIAGVVIAGGIIALISFLLFSMLTEFSPEMVEKPYTSGMDCKTGFPGNELTVITWNIGYGGLGREMDFFYDGGQQVKPDKDYYEACLDGISRAIKEFDTADAVFLQEIDYDASRSYFLDQVKRISGDLPEFCYSFVVNYNCRFVPVPVSHPMGKVTAGMASFSRIRPDSVSRIGFDRHPSWPGRLFYMKRCFLASRYNLPDKKQLLLVNVHNSAFDTSGVLRKREMQMLKELLSAEYDKGNYILAGGDWNTNPPGFDPSLIVTGDKVKTNSLEGMSKYFPGWNFAFDPFIPTNRDVDTPYSKGQTPTTIIDFFLLSPNIEIMHVRALNMKFEFSDHNPVYLHFRMK